MVHTVIKEFGWIDGLINNAGGAEAPKTLKAAGQNIHRIVFQYGLPGDFEWRYRLGIRIVRKKIVFPIRRTEPNEPSKEKISPKESIHQQGSFMNNLDHFRLPKRLVLLFWMLSLAMGCTSQDRESQMPSRPVKLFRVVDDTAEIATPYAGEVRARFETVLSFRVSGKITARLVDIGDRVHNGQILARLDSNDYRLTMQALKAQLKAAVAERNFSRDELARYHELLEQQVISRPDFDKHETAYIAAQERVKALEAQVGQSVNQLGYTELLADWDGVVTALEVDMGQVVAVGQPAVKLARLDEKEVHFDIPENRLAKIKAHQQVEVALWADGDRRIKAIIREIAAVADPFSRTYRIKATLLEKQDNVQLGMTVTVWLSTHEPNRITVPLSAIFTTQNEPKQPKVWLVDEQSATVKSVPVQMAEALESERIAVIGLVPGQLIVSAGVQRLREGQAVRLQEDVSSLPKEFNHGITGDHS